MPKASQPVTTECRFLLNKPWWQQPSSYVYLELSTREPVTWMSHKRSCLYHATKDGVVALCGARNLEHHIPFLTVDPSSDLMACLYCQGLVMRREPTEQEAEARYMEGIKK